MNHPVFSHSVAALCAIAAFLSTSVSTPIRAADSALKAAAPVGELHTLPGFKVELILSGGPGDGSWVNMCTDNKGRLIISPQYAKPNPDGGLLRVTLGADGKPAKSDWIAKPLYDAQGMVFAYNALWVVVNKYNSSFESGLYRITDKGNDRYENIELIKKIPGGGEHGPHAIELGPDGMLYIMCGNHTQLPEGINPNSPHRNYHEDHLLPRQWDGNGHAAGILAPGGHVMRMDKDGKNWELFCAGFRNQFDFAFNADGELFTYDSDMEWDWGMPWYRPTRVNHCVSGAEFGWRSGTGKWPDHYPDSLGAIDIGIGCPTGVVSGKGAKFPAKYQRAIYVMDWTYGRLIAVHTEPDGASYKGSWENFICPKGLVEPGGPKPPLNLTDMVIGKDGAMYFAIGGRSTAAGLYRVTYTGNESTAAAFKPNQAGSKARKLRHELETYHGHQDSKAVNFAWKHLDSEDRSIRYAARIAIESQPVAEWKDRALAEKKQRAGLTALLALARVGGKDSQSDLLNGLAQWPMSSLNDEWKLNKLRVIQLSLIRQGKPSPELVKMGLEKLGPLFPGPNELINRELVQILIYLEAPDIVSKTLQHIASLKNQEDIVHYVFHLRTAKNWTIDQRRNYFGYYAKDRSGWTHPDFVNRWFAEAGRPYGDGSSFANFLKNFRKEATDNLTASEQKELDPLLASLATPSEGRPSSGAFPKLQPRSVQKEWKTDDLAPSLAQVASGRNFNKGRQAFVDAQCLACHRFGNEGGGTGPDLTAVATRFGRRDILESITEPSKVVSEQFQNTTLFLKNGEDVTGRIMDENAVRVIIQPNPLQPEKIEVKIGDISKRQPSKVSPMPEGLVNVLSKEEILDLIAFLESVGKNSAAAFKK
ncbi:MAG: c-type cytochrome [Pedosphaera sp.]|nr:c-type cytochrome [Pedosphaera sp.]